MKCLGSACSKAEDIFLKLARALIADMYYRHNRPIRANYFLRSLHYTKIMSEVHSCLRYCGRTMKLKCYALYSMTRNNMQGTPYLQPFRLWIQCLTAKVPPLHPSWLLLFFNSPNHNFDFRVHGRQSLQTPFPSSASHKDYFMLLNSVINQDSHRHQRSTTGGHLGIQKEYGRVSLDLWWQFQVMKLRSRHLLVHLNENSSGNAVRYSTFQCRFQAWTTPQYGDCRNCAGGLYSMICFLFRRLDNGGGIIHAIQSPGTLD